jgi:hypothetical protein
VATIAIVLVATRVSLAQAELRLQVHAWQLRNLLPERAVGEKTTP